jgi:hypothetical protein
MSDPEDALERARVAAASMRAAGAYGEGSASAHEQSPATIRAKLLEWALIEPDVREVRSTRRLGAPVTAAKRGLLRLLAQYHGELIAQQTRFNVTLVGQLRGLEDRIEALERKLDGDEPPR